jgi:hypothetical protein
MPIYPKTAQISTLRPNFPPAVFVFDVFHSLYMYRAFRLFARSPLVEVHMATARPLSMFAPKWGSDAIALAEQAKVLSGTKLAQLVRRLQRQTGRTQEECWRFVIKYGIKAEVNHRRWHQEELDEARELLTKYSVEEVAKRLNRSARALRNALHRRQLSVREIRCDCFSLESLAQVLHVRRSEIVSWIEQGWLQATITRQANRASYRITPEALSALYKHHLEDLLRRRIPNHSLFEAYVQYCFSPKHTTGEQLLDVRRDKREREAFAALHNGETFSQENEEDDDGTFDS